MYERIYTYNKYIYITNYHNKSVWPKISTGVGQLESGVSAELTQRLILHSATACVDTNIEGYMAYDYMT